MNLDLFVARRIAGVKGKSFSRFIIRIAVVAVTLSVAVMIIASSMVNGFKNQIKDKMFGFWGHIHITHFDTNRSYEDIPISKQQNFYPLPDTLEEIAHIQIYAQKAGILKAGDEMEGIVLKGIGADYNWNFLNNYIIEGKHFEVNDTTASKSIIISKVTADRLNLALGDPVVIYFIQKPPRVRKFNICGIYRTGLTEYDMKFALVDIAQIQKLNDWTRGQVGGFEVFVNDINKIDTLSNFIYKFIVNPMLYAETIREKNPTIFEWLDLQDTNEKVILILMTIVAGINMITVLLVLILERTNMIGILKALGAGDGSISRIFLYFSAYIIGVGLFFGNILALSLCLLQKYYPFISLSEESYYLSKVPIDLKFITFQADTLINFILINVDSIVGINIGTLVLCLMMLIIPSFFVTRIRPIRAIRWE